MMKKLLLVAFCTFPFMGMAQIKFGYISYKSVYTSMPEYTQAQSTLQQLREKYDAEATRSEEEFNKKYADYLQGQKDFPVSILLKRQKELQDLMMKGIQFRNEMNDLLSEAEKKLQAPIEAQLQTAIQTVGTAEQLSFIINTDNNNCPFVNTNEGVDVTEKVKAALSTIKQ